MLSSFFRSSSFFRLSSFSGCLYFFGHFHFWDIFHFWGSLNFLGHLLFWGCLQFGGHLNLEVVFSIYSMSRVWVCNISMIWLGTSYQAARLDRQMILAFVASCAYAWKFFVKLVRLWSNWKCRSAFWGSFYFLEVFCIFGGYIHFWCCLHFWAVFLDIPTMN